jgi:hypothetical protein
MDIVYVDMINPSQWVNFFWENGYVEWVVNWSL